MNITEVVDKLQKRGFAFKTIQDGMSWPERTADATLYSSNLGIQSGVNIACKSKSGSAVCFRIDDVPETDERLKLLNEGQGLLFRAGRRSAWVVYQGNIDQVQGVIGDGPLKGVEVSFAFLVSGTYRGSDVEFVSGDLVFVPESIEKAIRSSKPWWTR